MAGKRLTLVSLLFAGILLVGCNQKEVADLRQQNEELQKRVGDLETELEEARSEVDDLESKIDAARSEADDLEGAIRRLSLEDWQFVISDIEREAAEVSDSLD